MKQERTIINTLGMTWAVIPGGTFHKDLTTAENLLAAVNTLSTTGRIRLLSLYKPSWHDTGKIAGSTSLDSSCHGCEFCQRMRSKEDDLLCICNYCYDYNQEQRYIDTLNRHRLNMLIMSAIDYTEEELKIVSVSLFTRVNSSGDTPNIIYARNMIRIAYINPFANVGYWFKNYAAVMAAIDQLGKPKNLSLIYSIARINYIPDPEIFDSRIDYFFIVCTPKKIEKIFGSIPCNECNGKKCGSKECGWKCYTKTHKHGKLIVEVLRASKKKIAAIDALEEK